MQEIGNDQESFFQTKIFEIAQIKSLAYELQVKKLAIEGYPEEILQRIRKELSADIVGILDNRNRSIADICSSLDIKPMVDKGVKVELVVSSDGGVTREIREVNFKLLLTSDFPRLYESGAFAEYFQNKTLCSAEPVAAGIKVETWIPAGEGEHYLELTNYSGENCWAFTGPVGETYILDDAKIRAAYVQKDSGEDIPVNVKQDESIDLKSRIQFDPSGQPVNARIVMAYEVTEPTVVCSTWGTPQVCFEGDFIYFEIGNSGMPVLVNPMVVAKSAFDKSYYPLSEEPKQTVEDNAAAPSSSVADVVGACAAAHSGYDGHSALDLS